MVVYSLTFMSLLVTFHSKFEGGKIKYVAEKSHSVTFTSLAIPDKVGSTLQGIQPLHIDTKTAKFSLSLNFGSLQDVTMRNTHREPLNQSPAYSSPLDKLSADFPCIPWNSRATKHVTGQRRSMLLTLWLSPLPRWSPPLSQVAIRSRRTCSGHTQIRSFHPSCSAGCLHN